MNNIFRRGRATKHDFKPVPFDEAFPDVEKLWYTPPRAVSMPDAATLSPVHAWSCLRGDTYVVPADFGAELTNVRYCTTNNVILVDDDRVVLESMNGAITFAKSLNPPSAPRPCEEVVEGTCAILRSNFDGYYHQLIEFGPRLVALRRPPFADLQEIKLLCPGSPTVMERYLIDRLAPRNVTIVTVEPGRIYRLERLFFTPFKSKQFAGYLPAPYVRTIRDLLCPQRPAAGNRRIFVSREAASRRRITNQSSLWDVLSRRGFELQTLEKCTPEEQIEMFYDAECVVAAHGAGLANLLFSPQAAVLELFPRDFIVPNYLYLCSSLSLRYTSWCGDAEHPLEFLSPARWRRRMSNVNGRRSKGSKMNANVRAFDRDFPVDVLAVSDLLDDLGMY